MAILQLYYSNEILTGENRVMRKKIYLSVVIPGYNELANFKKGVLNKVWQYLETRRYTWEVIVVDDGSKDGSVEFLRTFCRKTPNFLLIENPHKGKSGTVASGVAKAQGKFILFTDFDQATPLAEFEKLKPYLENNYEVVIGSREVVGAVREKEPLYRHLMGRMFNYLVRALTVRGISDTQCGFKAFKKEAAKTLFQNLKVYKPSAIKAAFTGAFDVEILFLAKKYGYKIAEVPIHWYHVETDRVNPLKDSLLMFADVVKIRFYDLLGHYEK